MVKPTQDLHSQLCAAPGACEPQPLLNSPSFPYLHHLTPSLLLTLPFFSRLLACHFLDIGLGSPPTGSPNIPSLFTHLLNKSLLSTNCVPMYIHRLILNSEYLLTVNPI